METIELKGQKELEIAAAKLSKAYLKFSALKTFNLRVFEYTDKGNYFLKIDPLLLFLESKPLNEAEIKSRELIKSSGIKTIHTGVDFIVELLKKP